MTMINLVIVAIIVIIIIILTILLSVPSDIRLSPYAIRKKKHKFYAQIT